MDQVDATLPHGDAGRRPDVPVTLGHDDGGVRQVEEDRPDLVREAHLQVRGTLHDRLERTDSGEIGRRRRPHLPALGDRDRRVGGDEPTAGATNGVLVPELAIEEGDAGHDLDQVAALTRPLLDEGEQTAHQTPSAGSRIGRHELGLADGHRPTGDVEARRQQPDGRHHPRPVDGDGIRPRPDLRRGERGRDLHAGVGAVPPGVELHDRVSVLGCGAPDGHLVVHAPASHPAARRDAGPGAPLLQPSPTRAERPGRGCAAGRRRPRRSAPTPRSPGPPGGTSRSSPATASGRAG